MVRRKNYFKVVRPKKEQSHSKKVIMEQQPHSTDENQNSKNLSCDQSIELFEEKFKNLIRTAVDLFYDRTAALSLKEQLTYLTVLKKITHSLEWQLKRIISSKEQLECIAQRTIISVAERKKLMAVMQKFVEYKLSAFPGTRKEKANSIAKHYENELICYRITKKNLSEKVEELIKMIEKTEKPLKPEKHNIVVDQQNMYQKICRLCGSKNNLIFNLNDKTDDECFRTLVEHYCRIRLQSDNELLPQLVCRKCKTEIEDFVNLSKKINIFQSQLYEELNMTPIAPQNIKSENNLDLDCSVLDTASFFDNISDSEQFSVIDDNFVEKATETIKEAGIVMAEEQANNNDFICTYKEAAKDAVSSTEAVSTLHSKNLPTCCILIDRLQIDYLASDDESARMEPLKKLRKRSQMRARNLSTYDCMSTNT